MPLSNMIVPEGGKSTMKIEGSTSGSIDRSLLGHSFYRKILLLHLTPPTITKRYLQILEEIYHFQSCCSNSFTKKFLRLLLLSEIQRKISIHSKSRLQCKLLCHLGLLTLKYLKYVWQKGMFNGDFSEL